MEMLNFFYLFSILPDDAEHRLLYHGSDWAGTQELYPEFIPGADPHITDKWKASTTVKSLPVVPVVIWGHVCTRRTRIEEHRFLALRGH